MIRQLILCLVFLFILNITFTFTACLMPIILKFKRKKNIRINSKKIIGIVVFSIMLTSFPVQAHPGRTDSNGGHYVRTSGWGYPVGSYHYHNGGSDGGNTNSNSVNEYDSGYNAGYSKGYKNGYNEDYSEFTYYYTSESYKSGYDKGYDDGFDKGLSDKDAYKEQQRINRENQLKNDYEVGITQGSSTVSPSSTSVPLYSNDTERQESYVKGFNEGIEKLLKNDYDLGYNTGKEKYSTPCPVYSSDLKRQISYSNGFVTAQKEVYITKYKEDLAKLKDQAFNEGYNQAFEYTNVKVPDKYNNHFMKYFRNVTAFKEIKDNELMSLKNSSSIDDQVLTISFEDGFKSNYEVSKISDQGFKDGLVFSEPQNVEKGQKFYATQYNKGKILSASICIILVTTGSVTYFFIRRKRK